MREIKMEELMRKLEHKYMLQCSRCQYLTVSYLWNSGRIMTCSKDSDGPFIPGFCDKYQRRTLLKSICSVLGID